MKKLITVCFLILMLTSCAERKKEEIPDTDAIAAEAVTVYESGDLLRSLETALKAHENTDAQRIIADVTGAYNFADRLLTKSMTFNGEIEDIKISADGKYLTVSDSLGTHLIDYIKAEIIKTAPKGEFLFEESDLTSSPTPWTKLYENALCGCEYDGIYYVIVDNKVTNGEWKADIEIKDGYLNIFQLTHEMYNTEGKIAEYDSIIVANGDTLTAFDRITGEKVFETTLDSKILSCHPGNGAVILACEKLFTTSGNLFSNKANSPLFPEGDILRLSDSYKFNEEQKAIAYAQGRLATAAKNSDTVDLLFNVSYDIHEKLAIEEKFPTAIASNENILALGTYEYKDGNRSNYLILYNLDNHTFTKIQTDFEIKRIVYSDKWQIIGNDSYAVIENGVLINKGEYLNGNTENTALQPFEYKNVTISFDSSGIVYDSEGNSVDLGFELSNSSTVTFADSDTLFITEYENNGECVLVSLKDMKLKATVAGGMYFIKGINKILYRQSTGLGLYNYMSAKELLAFGKEFIANY